MASITYWSQLQPSPHLPSIADGLAARVRDPAWMLARQWQLGELQGIDGGSPAFVRIGSHAAPMEMATLGTQTVLLAPGELLEPVVEAEPVPIDLATRVELGQTFESLVSQAIGKLYRDAYPIDPAGPDADPDEVRFRAVCAGRVTDGVAVYQAAKAAKAAHQALPGIPTLNAASRPKALTAVNAFIDWVESTWGPLGGDEPSAWDPTRLDYATTVSGGGLTLAAEPDAEAALDWHAFDVTAGTAPAATPVTTSVIPGHVRFRGMPNPRWWDFESGTTDFGGIAADTRDLAKLLFADFLLIHGDDWYVTRLDVPRGSLCWIDALTVTDVFGSTAEIPRADTTGSGSWTLFSTTDSSIGGGGGGVAPLLVVPAGAASALQTSTPIEEVHLLRDETADMAWAVERVVEGPLGDPVTQASAPAPALPPGAPPPFAYRLATPPPANWFPLMPLVTSKDGLALVAGTVEDLDQAPASRLVQRLITGAVQLPQHELSRAGLRLQRVVCRTRTAEGGARLWVARRRQIGAGEASSGLRYDEVVTVDKGAVEPA